MRCECLTENGVVTVLCSIHADAFRRRYAHEQAQRIDMIAKLRVAWIDGLRAVRSYNVHHAELLEHIHGKENE